MSNPSTTSVAGGRLRAGAAKTAPLFGGLAAIALAFAGGELLHALGVPVPGSVLGMVLLALALGSRLVHADSVRPASDALTKNMSIMFVPVGVGVMAYGTLLSSAWFPIVLAITAGTAVVLVVAGPLERGLHRMAAHDSRALHMREGRIPR